MPLLRSLLRGLRSLVRKEQVGQGIGRRSWGLPSAQCNSLYPNLSQLPANRAQTVQGQPNGVFSFQQLTSEPERNHPFAKPF
jgi:hypothetical protein